MCSIESGFVSSLDVNILLEFDKFPFVTFNSASVMLEKRKIHWLTALINLLNSHKFTKCHEYFKYHAVNFILYFKNVFRFLNFIFFVCLNAFPA